MAYITKHIYTLLSNVMEEHKDPRVMHLPLLGSPVPVVMLIAGYLAFVLYYGPKWMVNRKPYNLKYIMRIYNAMQVVINSVFLVYALQHTVLAKNYSLTCQGVDPHNNEPWMQGVLNVSYGYYITKYLDLLDTIFFILRKKNNQITFLHVYHHAGMVFGVYVFMKFLPGSHSTMLGVVNLFVHIVMYLYYFVTSIWTIKQALWWKKHITQLQLLQFGYLMVHFLLPIVRNPCQHPHLISFIGLIQNVFMFTLFFDFYYKTYIKKSQTQKNHVTNQIINTNNQSHNNSKENNIMPTTTKMINSTTSIINTTASTSTFTSTNNSNSNTNNIAKTTKEKSKFD